jgi:signal peptide peptidase SppA
MSTTNPILARFQNNEPVLIDLQAHNLLLACAHNASVMLERIEGATDAPRMDDGDGFWFAPDDWRSAYRPYVVKDGVLLIPVKGVLLNDFSYALGTWATGYQYIWRAFDRGQRDPEVRGIALVCDTPGGMVAGNFELVDKMFAYPNRKPVAGFAHESAYSAGYSIISSADSVTVSRTGGVGSIGVVTSHYDVSKMYDDMGLKITFIHAGKHKVDGNPYEALPDDVKARIQARIDDLYGIFVKTVARNRDMDEQAVRDTEALTYSAPDALSIGLADKIGPFDDALADFSASLNPNVGDETMADITQADHETALASVRTEATAQGQREGAVAERTRITTILNSDAGQARPAAALAAALETDMSSDQATAFLAKLPEEPKAKVEGDGGTGSADAGAGKGKDRFDAAMGGDKDNPNLGEPGANADDADPEAAMIEQSFARKSTKRAV